MWARYEAHINDKEPVAAMAYFCLTVLEKCGGGEKRKGRRGRAAETYRVDLDVLDKIGKLTSEQGGTQARKAEGLEKEFSQEEVQFLRKAIPKLIWRASEVARDRSGCYKQIRLKDLTPR